MKWKKSNVVTLKHFTFYKKTFNSKDNTGLEIASNTVANATNFSSLATKIVI